jgi:biotin operon repressor
MTPAIAPRIDPRERAALLHLESGRHSAQTLARVLGVSRITAFRIVQRLRRRGHRIVSMKRGRDWYFEVESRDPRPETDPLLRRIGFARSRRRRGETVDDALYGRPE